MSDWLPPQNLEAEESVIYSTVIYPETLADTSVILDPSDFYRESHGLIFETAVELWSIGDPVDLNSVREALIRTGRIDRIGGDRAYMDMFDPNVRFAIPVNVRYHAEIVKEKSLKRKLIEVANEANRLAYHPEYTFDDCLEYVEPAILGLGQGNNTDSLSTLPSKLYESVDRFHRRQSGLFSGLGTGIGDLDRMTDGLPESAVIVLAGRPGMGKSALALGIAEHVANDLDKTVLFVSLEMSAIELADRVLIGRANLDGHAYRTGRGMPRDGIDRINRTLFELAEKRGLIFDDSPTRSVVQIGAVARRLKAKGDLGLLVVDYIQLVDPGKSLSRANRQEQVASISRGLKSLSRELKIPVLALSQLNRDSEKREGNRPKMSDLRESGAIEQDAHMIMFVHRPEYYDPNERPGVAELIIAKNRNGRTGTIDLAFLKSQTRFTNLETRHEDVDFDQPCARAADDF